MLVAADWPGPQGSGTAAGLPRVCLVGPLAPPAGGMANQCAQLLRLLRAEGLHIELVQTNPPYRPAWVARLALLRAACRLPPYVQRLWQALGRCDVVHVMANSGWAWHLFAAPAITLARLRRKPVVLHYHGGNAQGFLARRPWLAQRLLAACTLRVLPSAFLQRVFAARGLAGEVIPNSVDLALFHPASAAPAGAGSGPAAPAATEARAGAGPRLLVSRHLEPVYDVATAICAFARIHPWHPDARLVIAGSGSERAALQALVAQLQLVHAVDFVGQLDNAAMAPLLASSSCLLNPSRVDNMPVSILEAFACGVPVVSTRAGGVPDLVQDGVNGLLVAVGDDAAMATQLRRLLCQPALAARLVQAGLEQVQHYSWPCVMPLWLSAYRRAAGASALGQTAASAEGLGP